MNNTSIINILKAFSKNEIAEFDKFIATPYINCPKSLTNFYNEIRKHYPVFNEELLSIEKIFKVLYPDRKFKDNTIRRLASDLKKILDRFIYDKYFEEEPIRSHFLIANGYSKRGLKKEAYKELDTIKNQISNCGVSIAYVTNRMDVEDAKAQLALSQNKQSEALINISGKNNYLIYHFIMKLAYGLHDFHTNQKIFNTFQPDPFLFSFLSTVDFNKFSKKMLSGTFDNPLQNAIKIYVAAILNYLNPDNEEYYVMLKKILPEVIHFFDVGEMYNIYQMAEALCWMKMETVDRNRYRRELFELNKMRLAHGVYSPDEKEMRILLFRQILMNALHLKEINWAENFVKDYSAKLPEELRKVMKNFSEAHINFERKEFAKSLELLNKVDFTVFTLKFDYRNLLLRIYIELNYIEEAISLIDSYKHFTINNKNVSDYYKTITNNFLLYCKRIIDLKTGKTKSDTYAVKALLEKENTVNFKNWLQEKLSEL
jgi:hypothetical protein